MKEKEELVETYCPSDCVYRVKLHGVIPACYYAVLEQRVRGCKISECDKYRSGKPIKARMDSEYVVWWEYRYDEDDNSVWQGLEDAEIQ